MSDELADRYRAEFPTLERSTHLISHSLGAMPKSARKHATKFLDEWENDSIESWHHHWLPAVDSLGDAIAKVLGVANGTVVIHQNVSTAMAVIASCLEYRAPRNRVVYSELEFPTVHYVWREQARRGAEIVLVPSADGIEAQTERMLAAIDERTLIVPLSHVLFRSSSVQDLKTITKRAHEVGAMVIADCYQSAGTIPLALGEWGVDLAVGGSVKWACGGPGAAYLYLRSDLRPKFKPGNTGWFGHARPFAFDMGPMEYAENAWRMLGGTPPIPPIYTARAGWDLLGSIGVEKIRAKSLAMTAHLREEAERAGYTIRTPRADDRRGGTMCFDFDGSEAVAKALNEKKFFCDWRPGAGIRASPHFYSTHAEVDRFLAEVARLRNGR